MIVACTGCSAKFRVADEKVGPRGAKLRCSKCQTVFSVQRPVELAPPAAADPFSSTTAPSPRAGPPPLPRRASTLDARAAFEVDLEPQFGAPPAAADPFAPAPRGAALEVDPFSSPAVSAPPADPFAAPAADFDPFAQPAAGAVDSLDEFDSPAPAPPGSGSVAGMSSSLSLEELTTPPARRVSTPPGPVPFPVMGATEDPFGSTAPLDPGLWELGDDVLATAAPGPGGAHRPLPAPRAVAGPEEPLQLDPFGAAAVAADPLAVDEPFRGGGPQATAEPTSERPVAVGTFRFREVLVSAMALAALLVLALAILVVWRGGLAPSDALRPSAILAALAHRPASGELSATGVTSGLYERARGTPLFFVRGAVTSAASTPLEGVRVIVEVVRDGAVLAHGEVPVGAVPGPEALYGALDLAALSKAVADVASPEGARLAPGASAPFLVAFDDDPANLVGASLRVHPVAGPAR
jgi:predicted Zn finger-like uncharacterized protein